MIAVGGLQVLLDQAKNSNGILFCVGFVGACCFFASRFLRSVPVRPGSLFLRCFRFKYSFLDRTFFSEKVFGYVLVFFFFFIFVFFFVFVFFCVFVFFLVFFFIFIFGFSFITDNISLSLTQIIFFSSLLRIKLILLLSKRGYFPRGSGNCQSRAWKLFDCSRQE